MLFSVLNKISYIKDRYPIRGFITQTEKSLKFLSILIIFKNYNFIYFIVKE